MRCHMSLLVGGLSHTMHVLLSQSGVAFHWDAVPRLTTYYLLLTAYHLQLTVALLLTDHLQILALPSHLTLAPPHVQSLPELG